MDTSSISIKYLSDCKEAASVLAEWLFNEFSYLIPGKTIADVTASLESRMNKDKAPICLVAYSGEELVGTISLKLTDMDIETDFSPWLAALFVAEKHRCRGIGALLIASLLNAAKDLGYSMLYLYTPTKEQYYKKFEWHTVEKMNYKGSSVVVMKRTI